MMGLLQRERARTSTAAEQQRLTTSSSSRARCYKNHQRSHGSSSIVDIYLCSLEMSILSIVIKGR